jgi:hypothetical protein
MYLVTKLYLEESNVAGKLARQFGNPSEAHWLERARCVGYLKKNQDKLTYPQPKALSILSNVDSNCTTNKDD